MRHALSQRTGFLIGLWMLFAVLVFFGIHGASTGCSTEMWAREKYSGYLLAPLLDSLKDVFDKDRPGDLDILCMARARAIRSDEYVVWTPYALSQAAHDPPFPLINTNIASGQNMLLAHTIPVWHITLLARPATWGYFVLGVDRGIAWGWWFPAFGCFTALALLLEIVLRGHRRLAAFGAFWFCSSPYVVCWSLYTAHYTFFPALGCLAAYHLFKSRTAAVRVLCGVLLGLSVPGFVMMMYPAHQVPLGLLFATIFACLFVRDKLYRFDAELRRPFLAGCLAAVLIAGGLLAAFFIATLPYLRLMADSVYPGRRVSAGGGYHFSLLFKGMYNILTNSGVDRFLGNSCEAASFHYLYPAVAVAVVASRRFARKIGLVGWALLFYIAVIVYYMCVGVPEWLAKVTLLSYVPSSRADIGPGLASIMLVTLFLATTWTRRDEGPRSRYERFLPTIVACIIGLFFVATGYSLRSFGQVGFPNTVTILCAACIMGLCSYLLIAGRAKAFCILMCTILVMTSWFFNPLSRGFDQLYKSELASQIREINQAAGDHPLWVCYGGRYIGTLVTTLGGRSLAGVHMHPQLDLWHKLDRDRDHETQYNRYAHVILTPNNQGDSVQFSVPQNDVLIVNISPQNSALKEMGARYVVATDTDQATLDTMNLNTIYKSRDGWFSIYEIPAQP